MQERITQNTGNMSREGKALRQAAVFTKQGVEMLQYIRNRQGQHRDEKCCVSARVHGWSNAFSLLVGG